MSRSYEDGYTVEVDPNDQEAGADLQDARFQQSADLHRILHSAYTFVRSYETNQSIAGLTLDHLLREQIQSLKKGEKRVMSDAEGSGIDSRPSRWDQIDYIETMLNKVVETIEKAGDDRDRLLSLGIYESHSKVTKTDANGNTSTTWEYWP